MPKFKAEKAIEFFRRSWDGVMANYRDDVVLSAKNLISNPDLKDFDPEDDLEGWTLDAPPRPTGWNVYARQLTRNGNNVRAKTTEERVNFDELSLEREVLIIDEHLGSGAPVPDANKRALIAPPSEIRAQVKRGGAAGYRAGDYWISYANIIGPTKANRSTRVTPTAPPVKITVAQGQRIDVYLPESGGEGVTGYIIYLSKVNGSPGDLYEQERVSLRNRIPEKVTLKGPFRQLSSNSMSGPNHTKIGGLRKPNTRYVNSPWGTTINVDEKCAVAYRIVTKQGISQRSEAVTIGPGVFKQDTALSWGPGRFPKGALGWLPEFRGIDGRWFTLSGPGYSEDGLPKNKNAVIPNFNPAHETSWPTTKLAPYSDQASTDDSTDDSGIEAPTAPLDAPVPVGQAQLSPGKYRVMTTYALEDEESAPGPFQDVTLRDVGGVTDEAIHVWRPKPQKVTNELWDEQDSDGIQLDWQEPDPHGTTVRWGDGRLTVEDTTGSALEQRIRISEPVPITPGRLYVFRCYLRCTRYTSGSAMVRVRFLDASGATVDHETAARVESAGESHTARISFSSDRLRKPNLRIPATATQFQIIILSDGATKGTRNLDFYLEKVGLWLGPAMRKRVPLGLGLGDRDAKAPGNEPPTLKYPTGPYCRVVENPTDGPGLLNPTILHRTTFEDGTMGTLTQNGGGVFTVDASGAMQGDVGANITGVNTAGYFSLPATGSRRAIQWHTRFHTVPTSSTIMETRNTAAANTASVSIIGASNQIRLNGPGGTFVDTGIRFLRGTPYRFELELEGMGTAAGRITLRTKAGDNPLNATVMGSVNLTAETLDHFKIGMISSTVTYDVDLDDIMLTTDGARDTDPIPTNYVEYWAPEGQPYIFENFMHGMRVPAKEGVQYTASAYVGSENVQKRAELLVSVFKDADGDILKTNAPLATLSGDNYWRRVSQTWTAPPGSAYLEFIGGRVADGLIRAAAFQVEVGGLTDWDNTNGTDGFFDVAFDTFIPGKPIASLMEATVEYVRGVAITTHEFDANDVQITSTRVEFRAADTVDALDSKPWVATLALATDNNTTAPRYVEMRTHLHTDNILESPTVNTVALRTRRAIPMLYRADGSDYPGGVLVRNMPPPEKVRNIVPRAYANGSNGFSEVGRGQPTVRVDGFELEASEDETVAAITNDVGRDDSEFIYEGRGKVMRLQILEVKFDTDRQVSVQQGNTARAGNRKYKYRHIANGVSAEVISEAADE